MAATVASNLSECSSISPAHVPDTEAADLEAQLGLSASLCELLDDNEIMKIVSKLNPTDIASQAQAEEQTAKESNSTANLNSKTIDNVVSANSHPTALATTAAAASTPSGPSGPSTRATRAAAAADATAKRKSADENGSQPRVSSVSHEEYQPEEEEEEEEEHKPAAKRVARRGRPPLSAAATSASSPSPHGVVSTKDPNHNAIMAKLNREKKKAYMAELEANVADLQAQVQHRTLREEEIKAQLQAAHTQITQLQAALRAAPQLAAVFESLSGCLGGGITSGSLTLNSPQQALPQAHSNVVVPIQLNLLISK